MVGPRRVLSSGSEVYNNIIIYYLTNEDTHPSSKAVSRYWRLFKFWAGGESTRSQSAAVIESRDVGVHGMISWKKVPAPSMSGSFRQEGVGRDFGEGNV